MTSTNSPWAYIREGLLSEGFLRLRFGGLIFRRAYFWRGFLLEFYGISKFQLGHVHKSKFPQSFRTKKE